MDMKLEETLNRLTACRKIRNMAVQTCLRTFQKTYKTPHKLSEVYFRNLWMKELEKLYPQGFIGSWYDPPPGGIAVIFAEDNNLTRLNYDNLRRKEYWPQIKTYFQKGELGYVFVSPFTMVDNIPLIGDFGFTYYLGNRVEIRDHYRKSYRLLYQIIDKINIGMTFRQFFLLAEQLTGKNKLCNYIVAITDKTGTDYGHTIPFINRNPDKTETAAINSGISDKINSAISRARIFINNLEDFPITDNCAFTFEPRFTNEEKTLPIFSFHTIIQFVQGKKIILDNFNGFINLLGMDWIKN